MWQPQAARSSQKPDAKDPGATSQQPTAKSQEPAAQRMATYCCQGLGLFFPVSASVALGNSLWDHHLTDFAFLGETREAPVAATATATATASDFDL